MGGWAVWQKADECFFFCSSSSIESQHCGDAVAATTTLVLGWQGSHPCIGPFGCFLSPVCSCLAPYLQAQGSEGEPRAC